MSLWQWKWTCVIAILFHIIAISCPLSSSLAQMSPLTSLSCLLLCPTWPCNFPPNLLLHPHCLHHPEHPPSLLAEATHFLPTPPISPQCLCSRAQAFSAISCQPLDPPWSWSSLCSTMWSPPCWILLSTIWKTKRWRQLWEEYQGSICHVPSEKNKVKG